MCTYLCPKGQGFAEGVHLEPWEQRRRLFLNCIRHAARETEKYISFLKNKIIILYLVNTKELETNSIKLFWSVSDCAC